jgi:hypothetical protein
LGELQYTEILIPNLFNAFSEENVSLEFDVVSEWTGIEMELTPTLLSTVVWRWVINSTHQSS